MMSTGMTTLNLKSWQIPVFLCGVCTLILLLLINSSSVLVVRTIIRTPSLSMLPNCFMQSFAAGKLVSFSKVIIVFGHVAITINRYYATTCPLSYGNTIRYI
jgi:hypothetical protein